MQLLKLSKLRRHWRLLRDHHLLVHPTFTHPLIDPPRSAPHTAGDSPRLDRELLARVMTSFQAANADFQTSSRSLWKAIEARHSDFTGALNSGEPDQVAPIFEKLFRGKLLEGMGHTHLFTDRKRNPLTRDYLSLRLTDSLLSLAEAIGACPVPSNAQTKQSDYIRYLHSDKDEILARVEQRLGFSLAMPPLGEPPVFRIKGCHTNPDMIRHAYTAHRIRELGFGPEARILEIGGGYGVAALLAHRAGYRNYKIVDLPWVGAIQMVYLGTALGAETVAGLNEKPAAISLLPPTVIGGLPDNSFDLVVNTDSLPEMDYNSANTYIAQIKRLSPAFLSINQEAQKKGQNLVPKLVENAGGYRRLSRHRHWMEQGYVEEYYETGGP